MNSGEFKQELHRKREEINRALDAFLPVKYPEKLYEAMRYSLLAEDSPHGGGKRLRPLLLLAAHEAAGGADTPLAMVFACALEMIHTYSLIHDDLPQMDNDSLRRGKPANHVVYGDAVALLAGDGLLNTAYELMARAAAEHYSENAVRAMTEIAYSAGIGGMVGGQAVDILSGNKAADSETLLYMHRGKTAELFRAALCAGGRLAGAGSGLCAQFSALGLSLGLAFQIKDDLLDVTGDACGTGKTSSDERNGKATFVTLYGKEGAMRELTAARAETGRLCAGLGGAFLKRIIDEVLY
ncbi:MAG: polyprenyl synthetase family protein [Clostridiales bacterium]|jgi:geranylgeranyl diphosphate synthase type II|nr:polyprenyl synthetase family protein [Clostridiales bacterium]